MSVQPISAMNLQDAMEEVEEGQDYEVVVDFVPTRRIGFAVRSMDGWKKWAHPFRWARAKACIACTSMCRLEKRYEPIDYIMGIGTVTKVAIENLLAQMDDIQKSKATGLQFTAVEPGQIAVVVVSPGAGLSRIFASLGVAAVVAGGQTMNPSTQDILNSFENLPTDKVIILPNNKNIILAANQAKEVTVKTGGGCADAHCSAGTGRHALAHPGRGSGFRCRENDQSHGDV